MPTQNLLTLAELKGWLGIDPGNTTSDATLNRLIVAVSRALLAQMNREIFPGLRQEVRDGVGMNRMQLVQWPVLGIVSLAVAGRPVIQNTTGAQPSGNGYTLQPADPYPPGQPQMIYLADGGCFPQGFGNIVVAYRSGYVIAGEPWTIPAAPAFTITPLAPYGDWNSDQGVRFADGTPMVPVPSAPAAGQYVVSDAGVYTFAAADAGKAVLLSYGYTPADITQAALIAASEWFKSKDRIGISSKGLAGQEQITFSTKDLNSTVKLMLGPYSRAF